MTTLTASTTVTSPVMNILANWGYITHREAAREEGQSIPNWIRWANQNAPRNAPERPLEQAGAPGTTYRVVIEAERVA